MKPTVSLALVFLASTLRAADPTPTAKPGDLTPAAANAAVNANPPAAATTAATTATTPGKAPAVKKDEKKPEPKIPGQTIPRANGTFLGLELSGGNYKLSFYDAKKKPMAPDVTRATARWPNLKSVNGPNRTVLNPNGNALVGSKPVQPPYNFNLFLSLLKGDGDDAKVVESFVIPFRG